MNQKTECCYAFNSPQINFLFPKISWIGKKRKNDKLFFVKIKNFALQRKLLKK